MPSRPLSQIVSSCLEGDESAWREFVDLHSRLVYSIPRRNGFDASACDDIFQDVFLAAYKSLDSLRDAQSVPKWLITTTVRACAKHAKKSKLRLPEPIPGAPDEAEIDRQERLSELHRGLDELGGRCKELLIAIHCRPVSTGYDQLSEELGIPRGSIGPTRQRCLEKLARILRSQSDPAALGP
ncbi:MAG: sigma-70 family RNA polymerase sigma factor [Phycisphaera sp.]|nr:MAG: sigma-70 family RNA polymerase sigma factor [Phycisphaera sp.]